MTTSRSVNMKLPGQTGLPGTPAICIRVPRSALCAPTHCCVSSRFVLLFFFFGTMNIEHGDSSKEKEKHKIHQKFCDSGDRVNLHIKQLL